jgi:hypothetical protein
VGVIDRFERLRHDAVIGRNYQHYNVGGFGSARTHARECFVARRIEKTISRPKAGDSFLNCDFVSADVLGDATRFASGHIGGANRIEQRGLAVIHVAHDRDHGRTRQQLGGSAFFAAAPPVTFFRSLLFET